MCIEWFNVCTCVAGVGASLELAVEAEERARAARLTGARLLDEPVPDLLLAVFGYGIYINCH